MLLLPHLTKLKLYRLANSSIYSMSSRAPQRPLQIDDPAPQVAVARPGGPHQITHDDGLRLQALALVEYGIAPKLVQGITDIHKSTISRLRKKARERGYNPEISKKLFLSYVTDGQYTGRPSSITVELETELIDHVTSNRNTREQTLGELSIAMQDKGHNISPNAVQRLPKKHQFRACKQTRKPVLDAGMMDKRLYFCLKYQDWSLEDWKNVIWTDETSVVLNSRRGKVRIWRRPWEVCQKTCVRRRFAGYSEFIFWGCFSYDKKGPCHIWKQETAAEKRFAVAELKNLNNQLEPEAKLE